MSNDNRELNNNELNKEEFPEGVTELSMEDLEQVSGGARPSYIVDGLSVLDGLGGINPDKCERIDALKDASSAATRATIAVH